jgi:UDP-N-acetylglucosamine 2-epimerase (non-hydrolysing)
MLWFCAGTAGELIKIYPLLQAATDRGLPWFCLSTGQSPVNFWNQWDDFKLPRNRAGTLLETQRDLHTSREALSWFTRAWCMSRSALQSKIHRLTGRHPVATDAWIVHGDTLSSLIGSVYGKRLGVPVAHVEAGLRSKKWYSPFPEEVSRRFVSKIARIHYPQDARAEANLHRSSVHGRIVCTQGNTLIDAIALCAGKSKSHEKPKPFVIANLHRFENLNQTSRWLVLLDVLKRAAKRFPVYLVLHPQTADKLDQNPQQKEDLTASGVQLMPRQPFSTFAEDLWHCDWVLSDGGSNQEECSYLGKPCLILRDTTERFEGLEGGSCVLSEFDPKKIEAFLAHPEAYRRPLQTGAQSPSQKILDDLVTHGHA